MRNSILLLLLIGSFHFGELKGQDHFVNSNSTWYYTVPGPTGNPLYSYIDYRYEKDTVINSTTFAVIENGNQQQTLIMEKKDKVYFYENDMLNLLYDFSVQVSDTVYFDMKVSSFRVENETEVVLFDSIISVLSVVEKVDTINIDAQKLKRISVYIFPEGEAVQNATWPSGFEYTERIGCESNDFIPVLINGIGASVQSERSLRCYSDNAISYVSSYYEQFDKPCDFEEPVLGATTSASKQNFKVYPNPSKNFVYLGSNESFENANIALFDITGRKVLSKSDADLTNHHLLNIESLKAGLYTVIISDEKGDVLGIKKLIKQ